MNFQSKAKQVSMPSDQQSNEIACQDNDLGDSDDSASCYGRNEWLLRFEVNEKGIGRILLPPSLTIFLQSDRVCIMPMGGGLFIKSV